MGMTSKQFQGLVRLTLAQLERALKESPDNKELQELRDIFQNMPEDGNYTADRQDLQWRPRESGWSMVCSRVVLQI